MSRALTITQISGKSKNRTNSERKKRPKGAVKSSVVYFDEQTSLQRHIANDSVSDLLAFVLGILSVLLDTNILFFF